MVLVGEITCCCGSMATATVTLTRPSQCFVIEAPRLCNLIDNNADLHNNLQVAFAGQLRNKLVALNQAFATSQLPAAAE